LAEELEPTEILAKPSHKPVAPSCSRVHVTDAHLGALPHCVDTNLPCLVKAMTRKSCGNRLTNAVPSSDSEVWNRNMPVESARNIKIGSPSRKQIVEDINSERREGSRK
jgi:hypothetical protein